MIKNIILDMGNVLLDYDPQASLDKLEVTSEAQPIILKELFGGPEWIQRDLGLISINEMYEGVKSRVPERYHTQLKKCCEQWDICMTELDGAKEFCESVKEQGFGIYILSNASMSFYEYFTRHFDLSFFDGVIVSADVHIVKPDIRIYQYLLDKYKLVAHECLFIDDREDNVEGAKEAGMSAYQFKNSFKELQNLLFNA